MHRGIARVLVLSLLVAAGCGVKQSGADGNGTGPGPGGPPAADTPLEFVNSLGMRFVLIPAGRFMMGSPESEGRRNFDEGPQCGVRITKPFFMAVTEVTQAQWKAVLGTDPSLFKGDDLPVDQVSWKAAEEFLQKLSEKEGRPHRFPTEAEWEYACRAMTMTPFNGGRTISAGQANYDGSYVYGAGEKGVFRQKTTPVASFEPNAWGLHDMHGNVHEWCQDWYDAWYYGKGPERDPPGGPQSSDWSAKILRGGSWESPQWVCRSAARHRDYPGYGDDFYGLRPVVDLQEAP